MAADGHGRAIAGPRTAALRGEAYVTMDLDYLTIGPRELRMEKRQLAAAGRPVGDVAAALDDCAAAMEREGVEAHQERARHLLDRCESLPRATTPAEPDDLEAIRAARPDPGGRDDPRGGDRSGGDGSRGLDADGAERDRLLGAWLGRCAGCRLGKPVETWDRETIRNFLVATDQSLDDYLAADVPGSGGFALDATGGWDDRTEGMPRDDDVDFAVAALVTLSRAGATFESADLARTWLGELPACGLHTAERVAYRNLLDGVSPPASARRRNPYRELIGGQIRGDCYGYVVPGEPERAAALAHRDARVTHVRNGVYGAMWVAATLAAVPAVDTLRAAVAVGRAEIPATSRLADALGDVLDWHDAGLDHGTAIDRVHDAWDDADFYEGYHVVPNAQVVAATLLWSEGRPFADAVGRAVAAGFDTDCNAATVGSVLGLARGTDAIPDRLATPLRGEIRTALADRPRPTLAGLADETLAVARDVD